MLMKPKLADHRWPWRQLLSELFFNFIKIWFWKNKKSNTSSIKVQQDATILMSARIQSHYFYQPVIQRVITFCLFLHLAETAKSRVHSLRCQLGFIYFHLNFNQINFDLTQSNFFAVLNFLYFWNVIFPGTEHSFSSLCDWSTSMCLRNIIFLVTTNWM